MQSIEVRAGGQAESNEGGIVVEYREMAVEIAGMNITGSEW